MAEWELRPLTLPPEVQDAADAVADVIDAVAEVLEVVQQALDIIATVAQAALDTYRFIVNTIIDLIQDFLNDLRFAGIYVLVDYPQNINFDTFDPTSDVNLAGTAFDPAILASITGETDEGFDLQAIAERRKLWNPASKDVLSYRQAVQRINQSFDDPTDPLRPQFSDNAASVGVVIMVWSTEVALFLKLVRQLGNLFRLDDLLQLNNPGFEEWFSDLDKAFDELTETELCEIDLNIPINLRGGGRHPNWIGRVTLQDLFPGLGELLQELSDMLELLRPNGDLTQFIQDIIDAIKAKAERLRQLVETLQALATLLREGFSGTALASVVIESTTGNKGFIEGLNNSTGHPEFEEAIVLSMVLYAGGPSAEPLRLLFSAPGTKIQNTFDENLEREEANIARPVIPD